LPSQTSQFMIVSMGILYMPSKVLIWLVPQCTENGRHCPSPLVSPVSLFSDPHVLWNCRRSTSSSLAVVFRAYPHRCHLFHPEGFLAMCRKPVPLFSVRMAWTHTGIQRQRCIPKYINHHSRSTFVTVSRLLDRDIETLRISFAAVASAFLVIHEHITSTPSSTPYISDCFLANLVLARCW
jgi:hypothetical protein